MENEVPDQNQNPGLQKQGQVYTNPVQQPLYGGSYNTAPKSKQAMLPGSIAVLSIGISACASSIFYFMMGIPGIVLGIIGLRMARKANELYLENPDSFKNATVSMLRSGKTCSMVGLIIGCCIFFTGLLLISISLIKEGLF